MAAVASLEWWLTSPLGFGLTTATPVQRAACRVLDGGKLGELASDPDVVECFGGTLPSCEAEELLLLGGIRGAKSLLAAAAAVRCTQRVDLSPIRASDVPRVSICSLDLDKARVVLNDHLRGALESSPFLQAIFLEEVEDGLLFRHPTGHPIEISVVAGKRAGSHLVSRWQAGVIFDEAARMVGSNDGVINLDHARTSVRGRLLPRAMVVEPSAPWAPFGPAYELYVQHFKKPTKAIAVMKCRGPQMNPVWWTPEQCERVRQADPDSYMVDVECEFIAPRESIFSPTTLKQACSLPDDDEPRNPLAHYVGFMDPGTRGNAWTLVIATREDVPDHGHRPEPGEKQRTIMRKRVVAHRERRGSTAAPLSPKEVLREYGEVLREYGLDWCYSDQWYIDANQDLAREAGFTLIQHDMNAAEKVRAYVGLRTAMVEGNALLPDNAQIRADLQRAEKHATQNGATIFLPVTADGRHCDYAPSVVGAMTVPIADVRPERPTEDDETRRQRDAVLRQYKKNRGRR